MYPLNILQLSDISSRLSNQQGGCAEVNVDNLKDFIDKANRLIRHILMPPHNGQIDARKWAIVSNRFSFLAFCWDLVFLLFTIQQYKYFNRRQKKKIFTLFRMRHGAHRPQEGELWPVFTAVYCIGIDGFFLTDSNGYRF